MSTRVNLMIYHSPSSDLSSAPEKSGTSAHSCNSTPARPFSVVATAARSAYSSYPAPSASSTPTINHDLPQPFLPPPLPPASRMSARCLSSACFLKKPTAMAPSAAPLVSRDRPHRRPSAPPRRAGRRGAARSLPAVHNVQNPTTENSRRSSILRCIKKSHSFR